MNIETLTENERAAICVDFDGLGAKALRIIDALTAENERLERQLEEAGWNAMGEDL